MASDESDVEVTVNENQQPQPKIQIYPTSTGEISSFLESMADVMSHGGDSAGDPPQQPSHRLDSACKKMPLPIAFDNVERIIQSIENNTKYFTRLVGNQSYFNLQGDRLPDEYRAVCAAVDYLAADRYHNYKLKAHNHLKERSSKNKVNWGKAKYQSVQGSKSFSATRYDERDPETQQWPGIIESFRTFHTLRDGNWVNPQVASDYDKLVELRKTQQTQVVSSGAPLDQRAMSVGLDGF
ncbi:putative transposase [Abeliophyllum distichum]|uniref:Transposase n=1 Tax=Abeliophyllum distichum TaxID=126358 RepID=A0ABD1RF89_9LAMI